MLNTPLRRSSSAALFAVLAFCASTAASAQRKPATIKVAINDFTFVPANVSAQPGDTIVWTNNDVVDHTATAASKAFDVVIPVGKSASLVVKKTGALPYFCRFHPPMKGTITVSSKN